MVQCLSNENWVRVDSNLVHGCVQRRTERKLVNIEKKGVARMLQFAKTILNFNVNKD